MLLKSKDATGESGTGDSLHNVNLLGPRRRRDPLPVPPSGAQADQGAEQATEEPIRAELPLIVGAVKKLHLGGRRPYPCP